MKKLILIFACVSLFFGCKAAKTLEFCEGVSTDGKGVSCGEKFSTGELTLVIKTETPFNVSKLSVNIFRKTKYKLEKIDSQDVEVKQDDTVARTNFYFYDEGGYVVEVFGQDNKKIAESSVDIVDI